MKLAASVTAVPARVQHSNESLTETMWAGEMAAVERARYRIERQGPRPGFLFGCNAFGFSGSEAYRQPFGAAFNFGTLPPAAEADRRLARVAERTPRRRRSAVPPRYHP